MEETHVFYCKMLKMPQSVVVFTFLNANLNPIFTFIFSIQEFKINSEFGKKI